MADELKTITRYTYFEPYDYSGMTDHFTKMAAEGWLIIDVKGQMWKYLKTEPQQMTFAVTHFEKYTFNEVAPDNGQTEFIEMCAAAGWQLTAQFQSMMVFFNTSDNPVPLETDPVQQVENVHKLMKELVLGNRFSWMAIMLLYIAKDLYDLYKKTYIYIEYPTNLFVFICYPLYAAMVAISVYSYLKWYKKAKKMAAEEGVFLETKTNMLPEYMMWILLAMLIGISFLPMMLEIGMVVVNPMFYGGVYISFVVAAVVYIHLENNGKQKRLGLTFATALVGILLVYMGINAAGFTVTETNSKPERVVTYKGVYSSMGDTVLEVYHDRLPFTYEDLNIPLDSNKDYSYKVTKYKSALFDRYECQQGNYDMQSRYIDTQMEYTLVYSQFDMLIDRYIRNYNYGWAQQDAAPWQAEKVIMAEGKKYDKYTGKSTQQTIYHYIVSYDDMVLNLEINTQLDDIHAAEIAKRIKEFVK